MDGRVRMAVMPDKDCCSGLDIPGIMIVVRECFTVAYMQEPGTRNQGGLYAVMHVQRGNGRRVCNMVDYVKR